MAKYVLTSETKSRSVADSPALMDAGRVVTYGEYHRLTAAASGWLKTFGIERNQRVAIISENTVEYLVVLMGLLRMGAVACLVSTRYPSSMIENVLRSIACKKVIASERFKVGSESVEWIPMPDFSVLEQTHDPVGEMDMDQEATILFTSGTTSAPKAVLHTFGNHYYNALGSNLNIELAPGDRWLLSLPLYHVGGLGIIFRCLLSGAAVALPRQGQLLDEAIHEFKPTHLSLVPTQLKTILEKTTPEEIWRGLKACLVGGGFLPRNLIDQADKVGLPLFTTYGLTEMASQVTTTAHRDSLKKRYTSGGLLKYRELRISDEREILVKGETLFKGYVTSSGIQAPFDDTGWFATGDVGEIDSDGYLVVTGRKDNMFISGGENIYPEEIESAIRLIEGVDDVMVVPVDDDRFGHRPVAFVKYAGEEIPSEFLLNQLKQHLPKFKIPEKIIPWPDSVPQAGIKTGRAYFKSLLND